MRNFLFLLFFLLNFITIPAQLDVKFAQDACNSLKSIKESDSTQLVAKQSALKINLLSEALQNLPDEIIKKEKNLLNFINVFNYKIDRNLQQNCEVNHGNNSFRFLPLTSVVDFSGVFTFEQFKNLRDQIRKIGVDKSLDILVLEVDNFYPFENSTEYSFSILNNWDSKLQAEKGKIIIVFSKELREIRISTDRTAQKFLEDEFVQKVIDDTLVPNFKAGKYYRGISETLIQIDKKL